MSQSTKKLLEPLRVGAWNLPNRLIMAPLTRCRADDDRVPNDLMIEYYRQRASAGLILTEATAVSPMGVGYPNTPGIWSEKHVEGWKRVTKAVHDEGGRIVLQLWHVGRISDPFYLNGKQPVAPSAIAAEGHVSLLRPRKPYETPRALETDEISGIVEEFRQGAVHAKEAGFDGVELHGANGYLLDQFLQDSTNHRTDKYGGSIENRARFLLEVVDSAISVWGADRVGLHLSPKGTAHDMGDSNPAATFGYVAREVGKRKIAFLFVREPQEGPRIFPILRREFDGVMIANENLTLEEGEKLVETGAADAAAWGQLFIANPDLPERWRRNAPLNPPNPNTFYAEGATGYTDYPIFKES